MTSLYLSSSHFVFISPTRLLNKYSFGISHSLIYSYVPACLYSLLPIFQEETLGHGYYHTGSVYGPRAITAASLVCPCGLKMMIEYYYAATAQSHQDRLQSYISPESYRLSVVSPFPCPSYP